MINLPFRFNQQPENLLLDHNRHVKIADFGLSNMMVYIYIIFVLLSFVLQLIDQ